MSILRNSQTVLEAHSFATEPLSFSQDASLRRASTAMALTTFPQRHFDDGASTITILVDIMMLGQFKLLVIASDMVNRMPLHDLMECEASDYAESHSSKKGHPKRHFVAARGFFTLLSKLRNSQIGYWKPTRFRHRVAFLLPGCIAFRYIVYITRSRIHETATTAKRPSQHCPRTSSRTTVCFANSVISP